MRELPSWAQKLTKLELASRWMEANEECCRLQIENTRLREAVAAERQKYLATLNLLRELVHDDSLSELARRIAAGSIVEHAIADITGIPVETAADVQWAIDRAGKLGLIQSDEEAADGNEG